MIARNIFEKTDITQYLIFKFCLVKKKFVLCSNNRMSLSTLCHSSGTACACHIWFARLYMRPFIYKILFRSVWKRSRIQKKRTSRTSWHLKHLRVRGWPQIVLRPPSIYEALSAQPVVFLNYCRIESWRIITLIIGEGTVAFMKRQLSLSVMKWFVAY